MGQREGPGLSLVSTTSSLFNANPIPTLVNLGAVSSFCRPRTSAATLPSLAHTVPPKPSLRGHCYGRAEKGRMFSPSNLTPRTFPSSWCGGCFTPLWMVGPSTGALSEVCYSLLNSPAVPAP